MTTKNIIKEEVYEIRVRRVSRVVDVDGGKHNGYNKTECEVDVYQQEVENLKVGELVTYINNQSEHDICKSNQRQGKDKTMG